MTTTPTAAILGAATSIKTEVYETLEATGIRLFICYLLGAVLYKSYAFYKQKSLGIAIQKTAPT